MDHSIPESQLCDQSFKYPSTHARSRFGFRAARVGFVSCLFVLVSVFGGCSRQEKATDPAASTETQSPPQAASQSQPPSTSQPLEETTAQMRERFRSELAQCDKNVTASPQDPQLLYERGRARRKLRPFTDAEEKSRLDVEALADFETANKLSSAPGMALALVEAGRVKLESFDFKSALDFFDKAEGIDSDNVEVRAEMAKMEGLFTGEWGGPIAALIKLSSEDTGAKSPGVWQALGVAYRETGKPDEAERAFRKKLELTPDDIRVWAAIANALESQGKTDEAAAAHQRYLAADPTDIYAAINRANQLIGKDTDRDAQAAIDLLLPAIKKVPGVPAAWNNLGNAHSKLKQFDQARKAYQRAIDLQPEFGDAYSNMAKLFNKQGRHEDAISFYRQALEIDPDHAPYLYDLGVSHINAKQFVEAAATYERLTKLGTDDPRVWNNYGSVLFELGKNEEARRAFKKALQLNPRHAKALANLGRLALQSKEFDKALEYLQKALAIDPNDSSAVENLGNVYVAKQEFEPGLKAIAQVRDKMRDPGPALVVQCSIHFHAGEVEAAIKDCNAAIQSDSTRSWPFVQRGLVHFSKGDYNAAIADFTQAIERDSLEVYAHLLHWTAQSRSAQQKGDSAAAMTSELAERWPKQSWQNHLVAYVAGIIDQDAFLAFATNDDQRCEAYFYIAEKIRSTGGSAAAKEWYQKCVAIHNFHFAEHALARRELAGK